MDLRHWCTIICTLVWQSYFAKVHLHEEAQKHLNLHPLKALAEGQAWLIPNSVISLESYWKDLFKTSSFSFNYEILCKAISLAKCFFIEIFKNESRGATCPKWSRKTGFKTRESDRMNGNCNCLKNIFWNKEALRSKSVEKSEKNQKFIKK